ncbi:MAG: UPF0175 family protein [Acidimicrobiia bacterium]|nr:UPF0175 family protein [Acidimicrobiia bacterium]
MANVMVGIPQELIDQLGQSALASLDEAERVRVALAIHLFTSEQVSLGRAAKLRATRWSISGPPAEPPASPSSSMIATNTPRDQKAVDLLRLAAR